MLLKKFQEEVARNETGGGAGEGVTFSHLQDKMLQKSAAKRAKARQSAGGGGGGEAEAPGGGGGFGGGGGRDAGCGGGDA